MLPVLFSLGRLKIYSFGVMAVVAFMVGAFVVWKSAREAHLDEEKIFDTTLVAVFWGLMAARLGYVIEHWQNFVNPINPVAVISLTSYPGLSVWGGMIGGILALWGVSRNLSWNFWQLADIFMPGWLLAWSVGYVGQILNQGLGGSYRMLIGLMLFLSTFKLEREYRTYEWYKGKRGEAKSGFVFLATLAGTSLMAQNVGLGVTTFAVGLTALYIRSGRNIREDLKRGKN